MSTAELRTQLHQLIDEVTDGSLLQAIHTLLKKVDSKEEDWWEVLTQQQKASIERGLEDIEHGRVTPHIEAMAELEKRIRRHG